MPSIRRIVVGFALSAFAFGLVIVPAGCGGGGGNATEDTSKYPPGQSPHDIDINKQMLEYDKANKKK